MTGQSVREFVKEQAKFDPADLFGVGRIRKLAYEYKMLEFKYQGEIDYLHAIRDEQAKAISLLINRVNAAKDGDALMTQKEIDLERELQKKSELLDALQAYAEHLEQDLEQEKNSNQALQFQVKSAHALIEALKTGSNVQEIEVRDAASA